MNDSHFDFIVVGAGRAVDHSPALRPAPGAGPRSSSVFTSGGRVASS